MRIRWALPLGRVGATQLWLDASWIPVLPFAAWSLAVAYFPENYPVFGPVLDWALGLAGAAGLWASTLLHEAAHLLVEHRLGTAPRAVTINVLGSVACPWCEGRLRHDAAIAAAGPVVSILLALATFWGALNAGPISRPAEALLGYLAIANLLLALLHAIPVGPFDAGWLLRSALLRIGVKRNVVQRVSVALGALFGGCLVLLGAWQCVIARGGLFGVWVALVGALLLWVLPDAMLYTTTVPTVTRRAPAIGPDRA
jgi:Zn-dependent protease